MAAAPEGGWEDREGSSATLGLMCVHYRVDLQCRGAERSRIILEEAACLLLCVEFLTTESLKVHPPTTLKPGPSF